MASYTDKIPTFNPYVQQLPVEAMLKVGMYKQQKYEEGVQRIQTNIDNVAGLDIGRDVDKNYLQSKLNALGNNLKTVAAGDFSDFSLVNSVNGMTKQIVKDEYVQAAVSSTARDRKQMSLIEEAKKKGTLTPHSEYNYQLQRNKYYNNNNLKEEDGKAINFSGNYNPSWDIDKHMLEAIKAVGDSNWSADNVFKLDGNGQPMHHEDGSPVYSEFAIREKRAGKFNENISAAIDSVLSRPEAKQELGMQGVYNYRGYEDINSFVSQYQAEKDKGIAIGESRKLELMSKINTENDPLVKKQYQAQLNKIEADVLSLSTMEDARIVEAQGYGNNIDNYKAALQTQRKRNDYMKMGVTETYSKEYIESIPYKVAQEKIKAERDWFMDNDASRRGWAALTLQEKRDKLSAEKWEYVKAHPPGESVPTPPTEGPVEFGDLYGKTMQEAVDAENVMSTEKNDFVFKYIKSINFANGKNLTDDEIRKSITDYVKNDSTFIDRFYDKGKQDVIAHPQNQYFTDLVTTIPRLNDAETNLNYQSNKIKSLNNDPRVIAAGGKEIDAAAIAREFKPFEIEYTPISNWDALSTSGGRKVKKIVTAQDALDIGIIAANEGGIKGMWKTVFSSDAEKNIYNKAKQRIETKFDLPSDELLNVLRPVGSFRQMAGVPINYGVNSSLSKVIDLVKSQKFSNVLQAKEEVLQEKSKGNLPLVYTVYSKDAKGPEITSVDNRIDAVLSTFKEGDINVADFKNLKKNNTEYTTFVKVDRDNNNKISLALYNGNSLVKDMEITKKQMDYIKGNVTTLPSAVSLVQQQLDWSGEKGTTNAAGADPNSPTAYKDAHYKSDYFFRKYNRTDVLGADVKKNGMGQPNVYFYVKDQNGNVNGIPYKLNQGDIFPHSFTSADEAENWINNIVTRSGDIDNIINNSKPKK